MKRYVLIFGFLLAGATSYADQVTCTFQEFKHSQRTAAVFLSDCSEGPQGAASIAIVAECGSSKCNIATDPYDGAKLFQLFGSAQPGQVVALDVEAIHAAYGGVGIYATVITTAGQTSRSYRGDILSPAEAEERLRTDSSR